TSFDHIVEGLRAMTDFEDGHADAGEREQITLRLLEYLDRKYRGTCREIENASRGCHELSPLELDDLKVEHVGVLGLDAVAQRSRGSSVEVDASNRGLCSFEDNVFGFLHVQVVAAQVAEHVREHAGAIAVPHDEHMSGRRPLRKVHDVGHLAGFLEAAD